MMRLALHWQILIAMVLGAVTGLALNATVGKREASGPGEPPLWEVSDSVDRTEIKLFKAVPEGPPQLEQRIVIDPMLKADEIKQLEAAGVKYFSSVEQFEAQTSSPSSPLHRAYLRFEMGQSWGRWIGNASKSAGNLFLRLLKMVSIPLIVTSLITGITGLGQAERLGKMFGRTLVYYVSTSMIAIVTGLLMVNLIKPGVDVGANPPPPANAEDDIASGNLGRVLWEQLENMIPDNPIAAVADGNFLSIISFSILLGIFTVLVGGRSAEVINDLFSSLFDVIMRLTMAIIALAPLGVFFLMLSATATQGIAIFGTLGMYMVTVAAALAIHATITMMLIIKFIARRNPLEYVKAMSPALLTAFSSASSNGTLPLTMTCVENRAGVSNRVSSFVLPLGATVNMDGTALYEVVAVLFIAQFTNHDLTLAQQIVVAFTALLASIGAAGIPHAGLVMMVIILQAVNLPTESQGLIIAVDRVLDMCRTSVNVWSDSVGCAVVARFEAEPDSSDTPDIDTLPGEAVT